MPTKVLDVGCERRNNHLGLYSRRDLSLIVGIDPNIKFISSIIPNDREKFLVARGENIPFPSDFFDEVYCTGVLEHMEDPTKALMEMRRVLVSNGRLVLDVPHPRYEFIMHAIYPPYYSNCMHRHVFPPQEIKNLVEKSGFKIVEIFPAMWKAAFRFTLLYLRNRLLYHYPVEEQSGRIIYPEGDGEKQRNVGVFLDTLLWLSEHKSASPKRYWLLSPFRIPNLVYPWVTYIEARKASDNFYPFKNQ